MDVLRFISIKSEHRKFVSVEQCSEKMLKKFVCVWRHGRAAMHNILYPLPTETQCGTFINNNQQQWQPASQLLHYSVPRRRSGAATWLELNELLPSDVIPNANQVL